MDKQIWILKCLKQFVSPIWQSDLLLHPTWPSFEIDRKLTEKNVIVKCTGSLTELRDHRSRIQVLTAMYVAYLCEKANITIKVGFYSTAVEVEFVPIPKSLNISLFFLAFDPKSHNCTQAVHQSGVYVTSLRITRVRGWWWCQPKIPPLSPFVTCFWSFTELSHRGSPIKALTA